MELAYHASHEQFAPSVLLQYAIAAEKAGFESIHSSDHFHPWSERQGHSGFAFSWIAAVLQATKLPCSMVCAPGQRYHPAIVAQAIATLGEMFPNRFAVELGSGEALNESITGEPWPDKSERNERLLECVSIIRKLLAGETVSHVGRVKVTNARIYSLPEVKPPLFCAAISEETCGWAGLWADGLLTTAGSKSEVEGKIKAFQKSAPGKPVVVQYSFSFARTKDEAIDAAYHQWRSNLVPREELATLSTPVAFDTRTSHISREDVANQILWATSVEVLLEDIQYLKELGVSKVSLHNINRNHDDFITEFAKARNRMRQ